MKKNINVQQLIIEFVSVVFAVILALVLNSWRESSTLNANLVKVKEAIRKEVIKNDSLIRQSFNYHKNLLDRLYSNENVLLAIPVTDFSIDVHDNNALASVFKTSLLFGQKEVYESVQVLQEGSQRVLILDKNVLDVKIEADTLKLLGIGNIQLKIPDVSNQSWALAQGTNTITKMDVELVQQLSALNALINAFERTNENALQIVYKGGNQNRLLPVIEDMYSFESKIIKANASLLKALE